MQSTAKTVAAYIQEAPEPRRDVLKRLRKLCRTVLVSLTESMDYGGA